MSGKGSPIKSQRESTSSSIEVAWRNLAKRYPNATIPRPHQIRRQESIKKHKRAKNIKKRFTKTLHTQRAVRNVSPLNVKHVKPRINSDEQPLANLKQIPSTDISPDVKERRRSPFRRGSPTPQKLPHEVAHNLPLMLKVLPRLSLLNFIFTALLLSSCVYLGVMARRQNKRSDIFDQRMEKEAGRVSYMRMLIERLKEADVEFKDELNATMTDHDNFVDEMERKLGRLQAQLKNKIEENTKSLDSLRATVDQEFVKKTDFSNEMKKQDEADSNHQAQLQKLHNDVLKGEENAQSTRSQLQQVDGKTKELSDFVAGSPWKEDVNRLKRETDQTVNEMMKSDQELLSKLNELNSKLPEIQNSIDAAEVSAKESTDKLFAELQKQEAGLQDQQKKIESLQSEIEGGLTDVKEEMTNTKDQLQNEIDKKVEEKEMTKLHDTVETLKGDVQEVNGSITSLKELVETEDKILRDEMVEKNQALTQNISDLTEKLQAEDEILREEMVEQKQELKQNISDLTEKLQAEDKTLRDEMVEHKQQVKGNISDLTEKIAAEDLVIEENILTFEKATMEEINLLKKEDKDIKSTVVELNKLVEDKVTSLEKHIKETKDDLKSPQDNIEDLNKRLSLLDEEVEALNKSLIDHESNLHSTIDILENNQKEMIGLKDLNSESKDMIQKISEDVKKVTDFVGVKFEEESERVKRSLDDERESLTSLLKNRIGKVEGSMDTFDKNVLAISNDLNGLNDRIDILDETVSTFTDGLTEVKTKDIELKEGMKQLDLSFQTDIDKLTDDFVNASREVDKLGRDIEHMEGNASESLTEIQANKVALDVLQREKDSHRNNTAAQSPIDLFKDSDELNELKARLQQLEDKLMDVNENPEIAEDELENVMTNLEPINEDILKLQTKQDSISERVDEINVQKEEFETSLEKIKEDLSRIDNELDVKGQADNEIKVSLGSLEEKILQTNNSKSDTDKYIAETIGKIEDDVRSIEEKLQKREKESTANEGDEREHVEMHNKIKKDIENFKTETKEKLTNMTEVIGNIENQLNEIVKEDPQISEEISKLKETDISLAETLEKIGVDVDRLNAGESEVKLLNEYLDALTESQNEHVKNLESMIENVEQNEKNIAGNTKEIDKSKSRLNNFENPQDDDEVKPTDDSQDDAMKEMIEETKQSVQSLESEMDKLKEDVSTNDVNLEKIEAIVDNSTQNINSLESDLDTLKEELSEVDVRITESILQLNETVTEDVNEKIEKLSEKLSMLQTFTGQNISQVKAGLRRLEAGIAEVNSTLLSSENETKPWFNDILNIEKKLDKVDNDVLTYVEEAKTDNINTAEIMETVGVVLTYQKESLESLHESLKRLSDVNDDDDGG